MTIGPTRRGLLAGAGAALAAFAARRAIPSAPDVVIVGAGMAGLAAARTLIAYGLGVAVVEARDRIGGRAYTDRETFARPFDWGAAQLHSAPSNPLLSLAQAGRFSLIPEGGVPTVMLDGREASALEYRDLAAALRGQSRALVGAARQGIDLSAAAIAPVANRYEAIAAALNAPLSLGIDYEDMSTLDWARQIDKDPGVFVVEGVGRFVEAFDDNLPIALEAPVSRIGWGGAGVEVETARGTLAAKVALVTVSTGVVNGGELRFDPALPEPHRKAFARLPMGHLEKIALEFEDDVLTLPPNSWFLLQRGDEAPVDLLVRPLGASLAVVHVGGRLADALVGQGMGAVTDYAIDALAILFGSAIRAKVKRAFITEWANDRYARGAFAAALPGHAEARLALSEPVGERIFFCGEANVPTWSAQLAGAYLSGLLTGERVAELLRG